MSWGNSRPIGNTELGVSEMFAGYEEDFRECETEIRQLLALGSNRGGFSSAPIPAVDERLTACFRCEKKIQEAANALVQMENELRSLPQSSQMSISQRVRQYKATIVGFRREFQEVRNGVNREALLVSQRGGQEAHRVQNARLQEAGGRIQQGNTYLKDAISIAEQTHDTGVGIMGNLREQREVIQRSRENMASIESNLNKSRRFLLRMSRRMLTDKIILMSTALVLSATLLIMLFVKLKKG